MQMDLGKALILDLMQSTYLYMTSQFKSQNID